MSSPTSPGSSPGGGFNFMSKDPAFLFYYQDFLVGTDHMSLEQVGGYIKCLCYQASRYTIMESHMARLVGSQDNFKVIREKFMVDTNNELFNQRLRFEMVKRQKFTQSRLNNLHKDTHMAKHMVPHMENENEIVNEVKNVIKKDMVSKNGFKKPTLEEVREYCREIKTIVDPDNFFNTYESQGWIKANNMPILNWKSTIRTWEKREKPKNTEQANNDQRDIWQKLSNKNCSNCRGEGAVYAPGSGKYAKCGCVK